MGSAGAGDGDGTKRQRAGIALGLGLGLLAVLLLAASLSQLELQPERRFALGGSSSPADDPGFRLSLDLAPLWKVLLGLVVWVLFPASVVYFFLSAEARRRVLRDLLFLALVLGAFYLLIRAFRRVQELAEAVEGPAQAGAAPPPATVVEPSAFVTRPPEALVVGVGALLLAALLIAGYWVWRGWREARAPDALDRLAREAQAALRRLQAGEELSDVVLRCYLEMSRVLREHKGVRRERAMTPREFERRLEALGVRDEHVRRLTRLFEGVRYGAKGSSERERREAQACLAAIVRAYGTARPRRAQAGAFSPERERESESKSESQTP